MTSFELLKRETINNFILSPGSGKKQLGSGSCFKGLLDPDSDSMNMDPKHWLEVNF